MDAWQMQCCGEPFALGDAGAMIHGLERGLELLEEISGQMAGHHRLTTVRAPLYEGVGDGEAAIAAYSAAPRTSVREQQYLMTKAARLRAGTPALD